MAKNTDHSPVNNNNQIQNGTEIKGNIVTNGEIRFDGILVGNLFTKSKIVIGNTGIIKGEVKCKNAIIEGTIEGKITVAEQLSLKATSNIKGDILTTKLAIEPGAKFSGPCNMNDGRMGQTLQQGNAHFQKEESKK